MTLNQILLIGRAGNDPEFRYTPNGTAIINFSLTVNNRRRDENGEWVEDTEWFRITASGHQAESLHNYLLSLNKELKVFVEGRLSTSHYTRPSSGEVRTTLEVSASNVSPEPSFEDSEIVCSCCSPDEVAMAGIHHHTKQKEYKEWVESDEYARQEAKYLKESVARQYKTMYGPEADIEADLEKEIDAMVAAEVRRDDEYDLPYE